MVACAAPEEHVTSHLRPVVLYVIMLPPFPRGGATMTSKQNLLHGTVPKNTCSPAPFLAGVGWGGHRMKSHHRLGYAAVIPWLTLAFLERFSGWFITPKVPLLYCCTVSPSAHRLAS